MSPDRSTTRTETGKLIDVNEIGWSAAYEESEKWLQGTPAPLFEAAIRIEGALALADVMLPEPGADGLRWHMIEVKSSTGVKDYHRDDLAVQAYIATTAGIDLASASLAHVDNSFVYPGGGDYQGLLKEVDLTEDARAKVGDVATWVAEAQKVAALPDEPEIATGPQCSDPFDCPFRHHCDRALPTTDFPLSSLHRTTGRLRDEMAALGYTDLRDVPDDKLSDVNRLIKRQSLSGKVWFDAEGAASDLAPHTGTAYFLDFETMSFGVPIWKGTRPYQQLPFQFSLHIVAPGGDIEHREFLDISGDDPGEAFSRALIDHCGTEGPVFVYNAGFENGDHARTRQSLPRSLPRPPGHRRPGRRSPPHRKEPLLPPRPTRKLEHQGSSPRSLSRPQLRSPRRGKGRQAAQGAFLEAMAEETTSERRQEIESQLLEYCKLDTFAMVRLWEFFRGKATK